LQQLELLQTIIDLSLNKTVVDEFWRYYNSSEFSTSKKFIESDLYSIEKSEVNLENEKSINDEIIDTANQYDDNEFSIETLDFVNVEEVLNTFGAVENFRREIEEFILKSDAATFSIRRLKIMQQRKHHVKSAGIKGRISMHKLLEKFKTKCDFDDSGVYFLCNLEQRIEVAWCLSHIPMSFKDR
jgi:hypothetical protein